MSDIKGRTAVVTGGGTGIGRAIARDLAAEGVDVTICGRRREPLETTAQMISEQGGTARPYVLDMTDPDAIDRFASELITQHKVVDIVVNNAGFSSQVRSARYVSAQEWRAVMDVNTMGPAMLTKALLPPMIQQGRGDVVMIASISAESPSVMAGSAYSAAKAAAKAYMRVLASEVQSLGIRCMTIYPGEVDTPILVNRALPPGPEARSTMLQPQDISDAVMMAIKLPRRATASDIIVAPSIPRDLSADTHAAMTKH